LTALSDKTDEGVGVCPLSEFFFFFFTLVTGPSRSLGLKLSDTRVYEPQIRARLGTGMRVQGRRLTALSDRTDEGGPRGPLALAYAAAGRSRPACCARNFAWFRRGLVFKAHRLVYHSILGLRVIKKKKIGGWG